MSTILYVLFAFLDSLIAVYIHYVHLPSFLYSNYRVEAYGTLIFLIDIIGLCLLWISLYVNKEKAYTMFIWLLILVSLSITVVNNTAFLLVLYLAFLALHIPLLFWYEVSAIEYERFETVVGLSYAFGFLALAIVLVLEEFNLKLMSLLFAFSLYGLMFTKKIRNVNFTASHLFSKEFLIEFTAILVLGEYIEILSSLGYYIVRDQSGFTDAHAKVLISVALASAFVVSLLSDALFSLLKIKRFSILLVTFSVSIPIMFSLGTSYYVIALILGVSVSLFWFFLRVYLYVKYKDEDYVSRFFFFYIASHAGGTLLYSSMLTIVHSHVIALYIVASIVCIVWLPFILRLRI
uniref:Uncharacterized protein n=1 Tax=Thermocrinis minervae TaxID=381751 RepID=A0A1M6RNE6_9AQUI|nr:hypothetical protein SAMN05444391_0715 [Thermocrinis minervae]